MFPIAPVTAVPPKPVQSSPKALDIIAIAGSKTTDGPPTAAVTPVERSERPRKLEARRTPQAPSPLEVSLLAKTEPGSDTAAPTKTVRRIEIDSESKRVLFQAISKATGEVVSQVPSDTQLRIREYAEADAAAKSASTEADRA